MTISFLVPRFCVPTRASAAGARALPGASSADVAAGDPLAHGREVLLAEVDAGAAAQPHHVVGPRLGELLDGRLLAQVEPRIEHAVDDLLDRRASDVRVQRLARLVDATRGEVPVEGLLRDVLREGLEEHAEELR